MEGFFSWNIPAWQRVGITRSIAIIPSILVAIFAAEHMDAMGEWLNVLQSLCLPMALVPLLKLTDSKTVMSGAMPTVRDVREERGLRRLYYSTRKAIDKALGATKARVLTFGITWALALLIVAVNMYLMYISALRLDRTARDDALLVVAGIIYLAFVLWLTVVPLKGLKLRPMVGSV